MNSEVRTKLLAAFARILACGRLMAADASRIVTIGGSVSETVCALNLCSNIVGSDDSSLYPSELAVRPGVGYYRSLSVEGIISLKPTLVIATDQAQPRQVLEQIKKAGVALHFVNDEKSVAGAKQKIIEIAGILGMQARGKELTDWIDADLAAVTPTSAGRTSGQADDRPTRKPKVLFVYARGPKHMQAGGEGTAGAEMIRLAGGVNAVSGFEGYKPLTEEGVVAANPDVLLLTEQGAGSMSGIDSLLKIHGMSLTTAGRARSVLTLDDSLLLGFGPRLGQAVRDLADRLRAFTSESARGKAGKDGA